MQRAHALVMSRLWRYAWHLPLKLPPKYISPSLYRAPVLLIESSISLRGCPGSCRVGSGNWHRAAGASNQINAFHLPPSRPLVGQIYHCHSNCSTTHCLTLPCSHALILPDHKAFKAMPFQTGPCTQDCPMFIRFSALSV